jgi:hypothetical protein
MTARVFPADPSFESYAERLFAEALREQLPDDAVMVCGQRFTDRKDDREASAVATASEVTRPLWTVSREVDLWTTLKRPLPAARLTACIHFERPVPLHRRPITAGRTPSSPSDLLGHTEPGGYLTPDRCSSGRSPFQPATWLSHEMQTATG